MYFMANSLTDVEYVVVISIDHNVVKNTNLLTNYLLGHAVGGATHLYSFGG